MIKSSGFYFLIPAILLATSGCNKGSSDDQSAVAGNAMANEQTVNSAPAQAPANQISAAPETRADAGNPCAAVGAGRMVSAQTDQCGGVWNIYASIANGGVWYDDKMGTDPEAQKIDRQASEMKAALERCGVSAEISLSDWFDNFTPDLVVVHSHPYASADLAKVELARAKACGINGYSKKSRLQIAGRD